MKVLVTGAAGQLGSDVVLAMEHRGHLVIPCDRDELDITDAAACSAMITEIRPDAVIHCAAYTAVDRAESDVEAAYAVNAAGTRNLVVACEQTETKFCYISTDYVFDGTSDSPYHEYDNPNPQSIYGKTKHAGEVLVQTLSSRYFIVRTSWVYGRHGHNFVKTMLRLGREKDYLKVVHDQVGSPTYTKDLAVFLVELVETDFYGIYHASNSGNCSWYEFACAIFEETESLTGQSFKTKINPCTTEEYPLPAPRPQHSVMGHMALLSNGFREFRHWREGLRELLEELLTE
ncbi:NAD(P)-dependent oxidoreductase [Paenibacillus antibioticophila]|uniref:dTDP-4-dehydrorhamnose reductase n=1 Tax=Paenibacillus antibioticophila TaxID=1274374 RepID=A0A919XPE9_9BACL|nr:dTDP-4-dehydrorhamnose reductase [Paenibacillus antibioticophila]GIO35153.1 NAD(P)-dependent oxidoreductase [Paenibacillus antibioticophila]